MVRSVEINSLVDFEKYLAEGIASLACWRAGAPSAVEMLTWLNAQPSVERLELARAVGQPAALQLTNRVHHNQVAVATSWVVEFMAGPPKKRGTSQKDRLAVWRAAAKIWGFGELIAEARAGYRSFESDGGARVSFAYRGNHEIDALDRMFDLIEYIDISDPPTSPDRIRLRNWIGGVERIARWERVPTWAKLIYRQLASNAIDGYARDLALETNVAGFTVEDLDRFWKELLAYAMFQVSAQELRTFSGREFEIESFSKDEFIEVISLGASVSRSSAETITSMLTMDTERCPDPALTPLIVIDERIYVMGAIAMPTAPHRNMLSILQRDPRLYGRAGELLGAAGERAVFDVLQRMEAGLQVEKRVKATRSDGKPAGDLDVVVRDPASDRLAIFEIKWHLEADGNAEVYKVEQAAIAKRDQVRRLRSEIESGLVGLSWPAGWSDPANHEWRWFILTRDVLTSSLISEDQITIRSYQLLNRMLRIESSMDDLLRLLDDPPIPPRPLLGTTWSREKYGSLRVEIETILA